MAAQLGRAFIFKFDTGGGTFAAVAGQRNTTITINREIVDITTKDDATAEGGLHRILLAQAGVGTASISVEGAYMDATNFDTLRTAARDGTHVSVEIPVAGTAIDGKWSGSFAITQMVEGGTYNAEQTYSFTLESAGEFEYTLTP